MRTKTSPLMILACTLGLSAPTALAGCAEVESSESDADPEPAAPMRPETHLEQKSTQMLPHPAVLDKAAGPQGPSGSAGPKSPGNSPTNSATGPTGPLGPNSAVGPKSPTKSLTNSATGPTGPQGPSSARGPNSAPTNSATGPTGPQG